MLRTRNLVKDASFVTVLERHRKGNQSSKFSFLPSLFAEQALAWRLRWRFLVPAFVNCLGRAFNTLIWTEDARSPFPVICYFTSLPKVLNISQQSLSLSFRIILKTPVVRCSDSSGLATRWWVHRTSCCAHCGYSVQESERQPTSPRKGEGLGPSPTPTSKSMLSFSLTTAALWASVLSSGWRRWVYPEASPKKWECHVPGPFPDTWTAIP